MNEDDKRQLKSDADDIMDSESLFNAISSIIESTTESIPAPEAGERMKYIEVKLA